MSGVQELGDAGRDRQRRAPASEPEPRAPDAESRPRPASVGSGTRPGRLRTLLSWVPASVMIGLVLELLFLVLLAATDGYDAARSGEALRIVLTFATIAAMFLPVHLAFCKRPRLELAVTLLVVLLLVAANVARQITTGAFDYGFVYDNVREVFTALGWHILTSNVGYKGLAMLVGLPAIVGLALAKAPREPWAGGPRARAAVGLSSVVLLFALPAFRVSTHEPLTAFLASAFRFHAEARAAEAFLQGERYPFVRELVPSERARQLAGDGGGNKPSVILLFLESWSGLFVGKARSDGRPYTPVFDARRGDGLSFDFFYGNSMQSSRGHFATLCSLLPVFRGKEFTDFPATRLHCLPEVLKEAGYGTLFYSATSQPDFEGGKVFFERIGFDSAEFQDPDSQKHPPGTWWGTGLQDDVFYERFFARIDEAVASGKPIFAVGANASNHYPFNERPGHVRDPGEATARRGDYVASLGAADAWLSTFFEELERRPALRDAIVVLVGDHSFPADEHGIHFNGLGSFEEAFRTGMILRWRGHVPPAIVKDRAASQLDLAPTITDLLQLRHRTHFLGQSLVSGEAPAPAAMVQPYDGVRLAAVRLPLKLVRHQAAEQEQLYDLVTDPHEERDLLAESRGRGREQQVAELRKAILLIHANQALLRANRVWPDAP